MLTESVTTRQQLRHAGSLLRSGAILAYPTEGVYGLGCDPECPQALRRLLALKGRREDKGLILLAANINQLEAYMGPLLPAQRARLEASWPGPVTWIVPAQPDLDPLLTGGRRTLAMRVTAHNPAAALCRSFGGAVVSTSANRSGHPPARSRVALRRALGNLPCLPGPLGGLPGPTGIYDLATGRCLRPAPAPHKETP